MLSPVSLIIDFYREVLFKVASYFGLHDWNVLDSHWLRGFALTELQFLVLILRQTLGRAVESTQSPFFELKVEI